MSATQETPRRKNAPIADQTRDAIIAAKKLGWTRMKIASEFGVSQWTVESTLRAARMTNPRFARDRTTELAAQRKPSQQNAETFQKPRCSRCGLPFLARSRTAILCRPCQDYANNNDH